MELLTVLATKSGAVIEPSTTMVMGLLVRFVILTKVLLINCSSSWNSAGMSLEPVTVVITCTLSCAKLRILSSKKGKGIFS